jgi:glycosyltransferase involved in cell wall biosynthesis
MKIALVSQEYLADLGHKVFVISSSNEYRIEIIDGNITVIRIPGLEDYMYEMTDSVQWITHSFVVAAEIDALHKRVGLDIIDFPEWGGEGYIHLLNRTEWNYLPAVIQLHGPLVMFANEMNWPQKDSEFYFTGTHMEAKCVQLADAVYSSSECSAEWIRKYYKPKVIAIPIIHLGVNTKTFAPRQVEKNNRPLILFIGKIVPNKGVEELVDATCGLVNHFPDLQLKLIGNGNAGFIKHLQLKALDFGLPHLLDFAGFIHKEDLPYELSKAHVFAAPSYYEGGPGFVYLEAMACGLPVIGCSGSGVNEIIENEKNGLLVPPRNSKALKDALQKMLNDKAFAKKMGKNARDYVLQKADSEICVKQLEAFYRSVIEISAVKKEVIK